MALFNRITIVGLGLIGGSLGMAIRRKRLAREVVGLSRSQATVRRAKALGAIDWGTTDFGRAVRDADLVVLATPVDAIVPYARRLAQRMRAGGILTDVGSTKTSIVTALERALPPDIAFVGAHPIAGSEQRGIDAASPTLFDGSICILTPTARTDRRALRSVTRLWRPLVSDVITMNPARHDRLLAGLSHLPHLLAFCLSHAAETAPLPQAPRSLLDMTRLAKSDPGLWDDICLSNRANVLAALRRFDRHWRALRTHLAQADRRALRQFLTTAHAKRHALEE